MFGLFSARKRAPPAPEPPGNKAQERRARKIVVPVDDSDHSRLSVDFAVSQLLSSKDKLCLISVADPVYGPYTPEAPESDLPGPTKSQVEEWKHDKEESVQEHSQLLRSYQKRCQELGVHPSQIQAQTLPPLGGASGVAASILQYTQEQEASMVVLGSRGMGGVKRTLMNLVGLGSVSDFMLQHSPCPVVVVKGHEGGQGASGQAS